MVNKTSVTFISYSHQRFPAPLKPDLKVVSYFAIYCSNSTIATILFVNYKRGSQYFRRGMEFESRNIKGFIKGYIYLCKISLGDPVGLNKIHKEIAAIARIEIQNIV